jgi:hypothetical protein
VARPLGAQELTYWKAQPGPQTKFVDSEAFEAVYGGARGGGKTDAVLGDFSFHAHRHKGAARGLIVRRTRPALEPAIRRGAEIFGAYAAVWSESRSRFEWPSGASLAFRHLDNDADANLYQGHDYTRVYVEELTQFPSPIPVDKLKATLRSAAGVRCAFRATCNPGGAGHSWVKARYIDPGPYVETEEGGLTRVFIPARVADNPALLDNDPTYVERLRQVGSESLVRAWLEGDWDVSEGAFFDVWSMKNIVAPFHVPDWWTRLRSFDWGYASPFSVGWWAVASDDRASEGPAGPIVIPRGALVRYREWYGQGRVGFGPRLEAEDIAAGILERERAAKERVEFGVADPAIWARQSGPSVGERMAVAGVCFYPGDNTRVGRAGAMSGWD